MPKVPPGRKCFQDHVSYLRLPPPSALVPPTLDRLHTLRLHPQPRLGCWDLLSTSYNGGLDAEKEACLYVGDAAGRPKQGTYKKVKDRVRQSALRLNVSESEVDSDLEGTKGASVSCSHSLGGPTRVLQAC